MRKGVCAHSFAACVCLCVFIFSRKACRDLSKISTGILQLEEKRLWIILGASMFKLKLSSPLYFGITLIFAVLFFFNIRHVRLITFC